MAKMVTKLRDSISKGTGFEETAERDVPGNERVVSCVMVKSKPANGCFEIAYSKYAVQFPNNSFQDPQKTEMKQTLQNCAQKRLEPLSSVPTQISAPASAHACAATANVTASMGSSMLTATPTPAHTHAPAATPNVTAWPRPTMIVTPTPQALTHANVATPHIPQLLPPMHAALAPPALASPMNRNVPNLVPQPQPQRLNTMPQPVLHPQRVVLLPWQQ